MHIFVGVEFRVDNMTSKTKIIEKKEIDIV